MRLQFDVNVFNLLPADIPEVRGLKIYQQHFANARELLVTVKSPEAEITEAAARSIVERLRGRTNLVASVTWTPPWMEHPEEAAELLAYLWLNQAPEDFAELAERLAPGSLSEILLLARQRLATSLSPEDIARLSYDPSG
jgi:hypothetical protein